MKKEVNKKGISIVEVLVYGFLLSFTLTILFEFGVLTTKRLSKILMNVRQEMLGIESRNRDVPETKPSNVGGFIATTAVVVISFGLLVVLGVSSAYVYSYSESVYRHKDRIQLSYNLEGCLISSEKIVASAYHITGTTSIRIFGCELTFENDMRGHVVVNAEVSLRDLRISGTRTINLTNF